MEKLQKDGLGQVIQNNTTTALFTCLPCEVKVQDLEKYGVSEDYQKNSTPQKFISRELFNSSITTNSLTTVQHQHLMRLEVSTRNA